MIDYKAARTKMVDNQIRTTDVTSHEVLDAFLTVPREEFVPAAVKPLAYIDNDIQLAPGRFLMEPSPLAKLIQLADIAPGDIVALYQLPVDISTLLGACGQVSVLESVPISCR